MEPDDTIIDDKDYELFTPADELSTTTECDQWSISYGKKTNHKYKARIDYLETNSRRMITDPNFSRVKAWIEKRLREFERNNREKINISIEII